MRLTVGPLPPAVYWRRRAVVVGGLLMLVVLLVYSCGGSDGSNTGTKSTGATTSAQPDGGTFETQPTQGDSASEPADADATAPAAGTGQTTVPDSSFCTDDELLVTPVPAARQLPRGAPTHLLLKIKNKSNRTCKRDVGADLQELYIVEQGGAQKIWSSDDCGGPRGNNVESFTPSFERAYTASWDGRETTNCKDRPLPVAGEYQLYGRVGTKRSEPVPLTLT